MAEYILTDQDFGVILKLFADATSVNIADSGGYFTGTEVETALQEIGLRSSVARPLNGFEDRTQSTLSWGGTRTLTLTPSSTDYYWLGGYRYSYSSPLTKQIDDTTGIWVFYFDAGDPTTLTAERNPSETNLDTIILDDCIVAIVYWNANSGTAVILADERHGVRMSAETHHYLHDTRGARLVSGGAVSGYTLSTATDAAISFDLTDIRIYDEDLEIDIADGSAANQYEQVLTGDAEIPVLYRDDTDGSWVEQAASTLPYIINGTPQPTYMNDDGDGTWSQVELSNNKFMLYFLMATNDWQYPVKMIQGQAEYATASAARTAINTEISNWSGLPTPEWCLMYAFVMQQSAGNTKELVIIEILDYRFENIVGTTSSAAIDHGNTVGLLDDDHTQYLLIDGTRAMTGTLLLNCAKNAYTSAHGIALDLSGTDDLTALQMRDSTDVAHGCTSWASTDTWGALRKAGASGGGLKLEGYTDSDGTVGIYMQSFVGGTLDATKSTAGSAAVNIICGLISGTGLAATITADCNLLAVRKVESGPVYTTVFMVDEDGDTWQPGHVGLNTVKNSYESPIGLYMDIAGNDTPCMTFRDSTDIAHGMTGYTDTSTWGDITKAVVASGGIRIRGFSETNYQAFKLLGFVGSAPDTTFSSAGRSACEIICGQMSGASVGAYGADSNVFSVRKQETGAAETTLWILDEDGDTWQSGYLNLESTGSVGIVIFAGTNQTANIVAKNDAQIWSFGCGGEDNWFVYDTSNSKYAIQVIPNPLHKILLQTTYTAIAEGATNKHYWTSGVYFLNDSANANMTAGITINQGASDDEIMSFKSSDVAHGATHAVETDSYGRIKKAESDSGGLQIDGFKDADGPTGALAIVMNGRIASNCDTTKSTAGRAIIEFKSAQTSGAADANIVADGNIFGVRGYTGGGFSTKLILDEDGDLWLTGNLTANGGTPGAYNYFGATTFINDTANTGMSLGLTIHQGANTDEILAFKNTNVGHGATDLAETDTFANFKTYESNAGGLKISSFKDADGIPLSMGLYGYLAENANTTKSNAGYGIVNVYAAQTSGASVANVVADGNIFSVQCRKGAANVTVFLLDEDGDVFQTGGIYQNSTTAYLTYGLAVNNLGTVGEANILLEDTTDVDHGMWAGTGLGNTYAFLRRISAYGGCDFYAIGEDHASHTLNFNFASVGGTANTGKGSAGYGLVNFDIYEHDGAGNLANITADGNIFSIRCQVSGSPITRLLLDEDGDLWLFGGVFINETTNAGMTTGITINQGEADDEIMAFKSSDVAHGLTDVCETDTWGRIKKTSAGGGGLSIWGLEDSGGLTGGALQGVGVLVNSNTTKTTAGRAIVELWCYEGSGTGITAATADANIFMVGTYTGSYQAKFIVDEDGDYFYDGADGGAFDEYDDAQLVRALTLSTSKNFIRSTFDEYLKYNEESLVEAGILGAPVSDGGLINGAQLQRLHNGAIWQLYEKLQYQEKMIEDLQAKLKLLEA